MATMPARFAELGDLHAGIDDAPFDISELLDWSARDERSGSGTPPPSSRWTDAAPRRTTSA